MWITTFNSRTHLAGLAVSTLGSSAQVVAGGRVAKLYCAGSYYVCRHCGNLAYSSQREDAGDRALSSAQAIRKRLGGSANMLMPFLSKPKRMHWRTYTRLQLESIGLENQSILSMGEKLGTLDRMIKRIGTKF